MLDWLFGRKDTAESLTREVNSFFDGFRRLQTRIEALLLANKEAVTKEHELNNDTQEELSTTLSDARARADDVYNRGFVEEQERHTVVVEELDAEVKTLSGSLRLATKVVKFAEEE